MRSLALERPFAAVPALSPGEHTVQFYEREDFLYEAMTAYLRDGLTAGEPAVVIATAEHCAGARASLIAAGVDVEALAATGSLLFCDADETLAKFMVDDQPDPERFRAIVGGIVAGLAAAAPGKRPRAYGEMVDVLWRAGNHRAAIRLEELWNELGKRSAFSLLCAYRMGNFLKRSDGDSFLGVCEAHTHVLPAERDPVRNPSRELAHLQQRSRALDTELGARGEIEDALLRAERAAEASRQELEDFFENAVEGLRRVGADGVILWANRAELELLGYRADEYIGRHIREFHDDADKFLRRLAANETLINDAARLRAKDGSIKDVLIHANARFEDGVFVSARCFTRDVTDRKHLESQLQRHAAALARDHQRLEATTETLLLTEEEHRRARTDAEQAAAAIASLHRIAVLLSAAQLDIEKIAQTLIDEATELVHAEFGAFFHAPGAAADAAPVFTFSGTPDATFTHLVIPRDGEHLRRFAAQGVVRTDEAMRDPRHEQGALFFGMPSARMPVRSYLAVPVVTRSGRILGGLAFGHRERARFTVRHEAKLSAVAALAASAIDNARLYRESREAEAAQLRRSNEAAMAARIGEAFTRGGPLGDVLGACCRAAVEQLGATCARIWTVDAAEVALDLCGTAGIPADGAEQVRVPIGHHAVGKVAAERRSRVIAAEPFAGYPLVIQDRLVGVFAVFSDAPLAASTLDALAAAADTIAIGIERMRSELERAALLAELTETVHLNELFTGVLAHDLRNPLGAIVAAAELVRVRSPEPALDRPLRSLVTSADRMSRMIDQLLDTAKLRLGGGFVLEPAPVDLHDICLQVVDELAVAHADWRIAVDASGDTTGTWDRDALLQVFSNLAGNAITHGELSGGLDLHIDGDDPAAVVARVANRGSIPHALLPHLFDPFYGTQHKRTGCSRGLGLGLFISKQIVTVHGGTIDVRSSPVDEHTTFTIRLPRRAERKRAPVA